MHELQQQLRQRNNNNSNNIAKYLYKGVGQSYGPTWTEQRRFALSALRDLGYGGRDMDASVREEVGAFLDGIASEGAAVVRVDERLFNASVLRYSENKLS